MCITEENLKGDSLHIHVHTRETPGPAQKRKWPPWKRGMCPVLHTCWEPAFLNQGAAGVEQIHSGVGLVDSPPTMSS